MIAIAFFLARGFIKTGLGNRISYMIVSAFGNTTLGLTYSLVFAEALLAPAIPSVAARAGGIFLPICKVGLISCGMETCWLHVTCWTCIAQPWYKLGPIRCRALVTTDCVITTQ